MYAMPGSSATYPMLDMVSQQIYDKGRPSKGEAIMKVRPQAPDKQQGVFCRGFFWVKFGGGRIGGEGGVFVAGSFAGFGQRVRIGVWPGR